jgi:hypothetical protein
MCERDREGEREREGEGEGEGEEGGGEGGRRETERRHSRIYAHMHVACVHTNIQTYVLRHAWIDAYECMHVCTYAGMYVCKYE